MSQLRSELEYIDEMGSVGSDWVKLEDSQATKWSSTLPQHTYLSAILHPPNIKIRVHDDTHIVVGIAHISSRKDNRVYERQKEQASTRATQLLQFYLARCHVGGDGTYCQLNKKSLVIFTQSNTDFSTSDITGIIELKQILQQAKPGSKVAIISSQTDGLRTNMTGLRKFMEPFLALELEIELVVWWSNTEYYSYDMARLFQQIDIKTSGGAMDSHYERFLTSITVVSRKKEGMSRALSDNRHQQRLGFRNVLPIDATDVTLPEETKSKALQKKGPLPSQSNDLPRPFACDICSRKFRYLDNLKKHTRNVHNPVQQQCPHCNGTFKSQDSLQDHILRSCSAVPRGMITCPNAGCSKAMPRNSIHHHIRVNHSQSEQVEEFGDLMGVGEWVLN